MLYEWRNVPRSDGYSPAQLLFGRAQRTSLPTIPCQNKPIDFESAASAKDAAHARSKLDYDKSKLSLSCLSPGQDVFLQDSRSSAWDKRGVIVSVCPTSSNRIIDISLAHAACYVLSHLPHLYCLNRPLLILLSQACLLYTSPSPRDRQKSRMPSSA